MEMQTVLNQQVAVTGRLWGFHVNAQQAKAQVSPGWHPPKGEDREKNYGWKSAFFLQYPSMFGKVLWQFRGAMTGSRMSAHLSRNRRQTAAEDIYNLCNKPIMYSINPKLLYCNRSPETATVGCWIIITWMKLRRAAESVSPCCAVNGWNAHSRGWREVCETSWLRLRWQIEGRALTSIRALLPLPGKQVASGTIHTDLPVDLYRIAAHGG